MEQDILSLTTPIKVDEIKALNPGDQILLSGQIFTGRDVALPKLVQLANQGELVDMGIELTGGVIFHTAVSRAGTGPTSSNKQDIENSIVQLSKHGIRIHLGKGTLSNETILNMSNYDAAFAIIPPVTALLKKKIIKQNILLFPEAGVEAFHVLEIKSVPAIIAAVNGDSIFGRERI